MPDGPSQNPYQPPQADHQPRRSWRDLTRRSFWVGHGEQHLVELHVSPWTGWESYFVDGRKVRSTLTISGRVQLEVGEVERHEVRFDIFLSGRVIVTVDGNLVDGDLFRELRFVWWYLTAVALAVIGVATLVLVKG